MPEVLERARLGHRATRLSPPSLVAAVIGIVGLAIVGVPSGDNVADADDDPDMPLLVVSSVARHLLFMAAVGFVLSLVEWVRCLVGRDLEADRPAGANDAPPPTQRWREGAPGPAGGVKPMQGGMRT